MDETKKSLLRLLENKKIFLPTVVQEYLDSSASSLTEKQLKGLLDEAHLQEYSLLRQRNDPDAMYTSPEYIKKDVSNNVYEKIGRATEPKSIYSYTEPSTLEALAKKMKAQAYYHKDKDELVYPSTSVLNQLINNNPELASKISKETEAHEYMHRGFKESPIRQPTVENIYNRKYSPGVSESDEHLYIYAKTSPERLEEIRQKFYSNIDKDSFDAGVKKIIKRIDKKRAKIAKEQLEDMVNKF
jgi:hypothetical protein